MAGYNMIYTADTHILVIDTVTYILKNNRRSQNERKVRNTFSEYIKGIRKGQAY